MKLYIKEFYKKTRFIAVMGGFISKRKYFIVIDTKTGNRLENYRYSTYEIARIKAQQLEITYK